jgi:hypothetical protein
MDARKHLRVHPPVPTRMNSQPLILLLPSRVPPQASCLISTSVGIPGGVHDKRDKYFSIQERVQPISPKTTDIQNEQGGGIVLTNYSIQMCNDQVFPFSSHNSE